MKSINSPAFGKIDLLDEDEEVFLDLKRMVETYPANAFGILNKLLNSKSIMINLILPDNFEMTPECDRGDQ